jgi:hypothetical protein|tara:strand:- start:21679 stop:22176 length:498 start_codon:yes stop_codon:yes gene_type:complete
MKTILPLISSILFFIIGINFSFGQEEEPIVNVEYYSPSCLTAPEGFETRDGFPGYINISTKSSIVLSLVKNKTLVDAEAAMSEEYFTKEKVTLVSKEQVETTNHEKGILYKFKFQINGEDWLRYSLFLGDLSNVLWVNANYMEKYKSVVEEELLRSILTTKFNAK